MKGKEKATRKKGGAGPREKWEGEVKVYLTPRQVGSQNVQDGGARGKKLVK